MEHCLKRGKERKKLIKLVNGALPEKRESGRK